MPSFRRILQFATAIGAGLVLVAAPSAAFAASPHTGAVAPVSVLGVHGDVNDFTFDSFDATYELGRDSGGHSTLKTTETLVAEFPTIDQNHGIKRAIPASYAGHSTGIHIVSVTRNGAKNEYQIGHESADNGDALLTIAIPAADGAYVHGKQTYTIVYTQSNVTQYFSDTKDDEFYWDTNGTGWEQPFGEVSAKVVLGSGLTNDLNGKTYCYQGPEGSNTPCTLTRSDGIFTAAVQKLGPYENMTVAIGFDKGTFAGAPFNIFDYVPGTALFGSLGVLAAAALALIFRFLIWRPRSGDPIIAEYEPPTGISAMLAANIVGKPKRGMAASIVDLAVRKKIRIVERQSDGVFKSEMFGVQQLDDSGLLPDEQSVMGALFSFFDVSSIMSRFNFGGANAFSGAAGWAGAASGQLPPGIQIIGGQPAVVAAPPAAAPAAATPTATAQKAPDPNTPVRWLTKHDTMLGSAVQSMTKQVESEAEANGLRRGRPHGILALCVILGIGGLALLLFTAIGDDGSGIGVAWGVVGLNVGIWVLIGALGLVGSIKPLTNAGSKLWDQLEGLKLYIRLAEADRLRMLQSVTGAERTDAGNNTKIIEIYERLLPYAVLFGLEQQWAGELAKYYGNATPDWYDGGFNTFNAGLFAGSIAGLSSSISTSYSGSSGSSSSGGDGGGGGSGGGGGGGGGGGI